MSDLLSTALSIAGQILQHYENGQFMKQECERCDASGMWPQFRRLQEALNSSHQLVGETPFRPRSPAAVVSGV